MAEYIVNETNYQLATRQQIVDELIRCKDCKYFRKDYGWNRIECTVCAISPIHKVIRKPDDFCSRAERRTDVDANP